MFPPSAFYMGIAFCCVYCLLITNINDKRQITATRRFRYQRNSNQTNIDQVISLELNYGLFINKRCHHFALHLRLKIYIPQRLLNHPQNVSVCTTKKTKTSHSRFVLVFLPLNEPLCTVGSTVEIRLTLCKSPEKSPKLLGVLKDGSQSWRRCERGISRNS